MFELKVAGIMLLNYTAFSTSISITTTPSSSSSTTTTSSLFHRHHHPHPRLHHPIADKGRRSWALHNYFSPPRVSPNNHNQTTPAIASAATSSSSSSSSSLVLLVDPASDVVRNFYSGINSRDLASVENLIADNCVYEDLIFPRPFTGRQEILEFFKKFIGTISTDLQFVIDDISNEDNSAVGVTWHLEWKGKPFPFSKGCSFYRLEVLNGKRQIIYGRDSVEPSIKPGETALVAIRGVTWLLQQFPQLAGLL